jgi:hypothetical protein
LSARLTAILLCLLTTNCAAISPRPQPAELPPGVYGIYQDNDVGAINQSSWALAEPSRLRGNPVDAVKAVLAVDYLADELAANPRWLLISPITKQHLLEARADVRRLMGIPPSAPSQLVANSLLQTLWVLRSGDRAEVMQALALPVFTLSPDQTLQILTDMPYIRSANIATSEAATEALSEGDHRR